VTAPSSGESLSRALGFSESVVEIGMTHPGVRRVMPGGTASFLAELDDDRIVGLEVEIGLGHRGFEKEAASRPWPLVLPYVSRLGQASGLQAGVAWCGAVEGLAGLVLPARAVWLRTLAAELARVADHFARLAAVAIAIEAPGAQRVAFEAGDLALTLLETVMGRGLFGGWLRLGGVASALPEALEAPWNETTGVLRASLSRFEALSVHGPGAILRLRDVAPISLEEGLAWSVTGPALRAAGSPADLRKDAPYLAYGEVDFDVPIGESGDGHDRLLVVVEEIRQSLEIADQCRQALDGLGPGPIRVDDVRWHGLSESESDAEGEGARALAEGPPVPAGENGYRVESSTGELGFWVVSDGGGQARRVRCRAPSFFHAQALPVMLVGANLDDLLPTLATMHLVSAECDR